MAIQSILIPKQANNSDLGKAMAQTLQEALGDDWEYNDADKITVTNINGLGFEFYAYSTNRTDVYIINAQGIRQTSGIQLSYVANNTYYLDIQKNISGAFAIGFRVSSGKTILQIACAKSNKTEKWNIFAAGRVANEEETQSYQVGSTFVSNDSNAFSMCKMPDIRQGGILEELYMVLSSPVVSGYLPYEVSFDSKKYVIIQSGTTNNALALQET